MIITLRDFAVRTSIHVALLSIASSAMATYSTLPESVKCLDGVDYEVVKHTPHFEWVVESENAIKDLGVKVFETLGLNDEKTLKIAVDHLDKYQESIKTKMDELVKQVASKADVNALAKTFAADWAEAAKIQASARYYHMGDGPTAQKVRWGFESAIKYITICSTHLAGKDDGVEYKKFVSKYVKDVIIQSLIDEMKILESELETLKNSSS